MSKIIALVAVVAAIIVGIVIASTDNVLIPTNATEVQACFDLANAIHNTRGGEGAYNVCTTNVNAYEAWKALQ